MSKIEPYITSIPDFPERGRHLPGHHHGDRQRGRLAAFRGRNGGRCWRGENFDVIAGLESRGFLFGMPIAYKLHKAFIPIRKAGKLPRETAGMSYELEYGTASIEVHRNDIRPGMRVVLIDDLIATGGTLGSGGQAARIARRNRGQDRVPAGAEGTARPRPFAELPRSPPLCPTTANKQKGKKRKQKGAETTHV